MTEQERVADLCERLEETSEWTNQRPYFHAHDKSLEASTALKRLAARCDALEGVLNAARDVVANTYVGQHHRPVNLRSRYGNYEARYYHKLRAAIAALGSDPA